MPRHRNPQRLPLCFTACAAQFDVLVVPEMHQGLVHQTPSPHRLSNACQHKGLSSEGRAVFMAVDGVGLAGGREEIAFLIERDMVKFAALIPWVVNTSKPPGSTASHNTLSQRDQVLRGRWLNNDSTNTSPIAPGPLPAQAHWQT